MLVVRDFGLGALIRVPVRQEQSVYVWKISDVTKSTCAVSVTYASRYGTVDLAT